MDGFDDTDDDDFIAILDNLDETAAAATSPANPADTVDNQSAPTAAHLASLHAHFGHTHFRPTQWHVIRTALLARRDCCCVMATGYGKSLCYQFPAVHSGGCTLVVSPLISLMQDQVLALQVANIPAAYLGSAQTDSRSVLQRAAAGELRVLYVSPEYITGDNGAELLHRTLAGQLRLIAIDEAHCVSQWGHDFRSSYRRLGRLRDGAEHLAGVPILAVTATATERVRRDICENLRLRRPEMVCTGFDRPNLEFVVRPKSTVWEDVGALLQTPEAKSAIIYCITRKETERVADVLLAHGVQCAAYHAGLSVGVRQSIHERFVRDRLPVIVATVAFGMGIDKPDIRLVVHYGASKDVESYYQEVGRAGRDGQLAQCVMFYAARDFDVHELVQSAKAGGGPGMMTGNARELNTRMKQFVYGTGCRRLHLLQYFGDSAASACKPRANCCDRCSRPASQHHSIYADFNEQGEFDFATDAALLLEAVQVFGGHCGLGKPVQLLRGSSVAAMRAHSDNRLHGRGRYKSDEYWKQLAEMLECAGQLERRRVPARTPGGFPYTAVQVTRSGERWLAQRSGGDGSLTLWLQPSDTMLRFMRRTQTAAPVDLAEKNSSAAAAGSLLVVRSAEPSAVEQLRKKLLLCRAALATRHNAMPYMVASNRALEQLAAVQPTDLLALREARVDGFSEAKIAQFGATLVECIVQHRKTLLQSTDGANSSSNSPYGPLYDLLLTMPLPGVRITDAQLRVLPLIHKRPPLSLATIATECGVKESTICGYTALLIRAGHAIWRDDLERLFGVTEKVFDRIAGCLPAGEAILTVQLRPIKDQLSEAITWDQVRAVLSYRTVREHLRLQGVQFREPDPFYAKDPEGEEKAADEKPIEDGEQSEPTAETVAEATANDDDDELHLLPDELQDLMEDLNLPRHVSQPDDSSFADDDNDDSLFDGLDGPATDMQSSEPQKDHALLNANDDSLFDGLENVVPANNATTATEAKPQTCVVAKKRTAVCYVADSDEEEEEATASQTSATNNKRVLPAWMLNKQAQSSTSGAAADANKEFSAVLKKKKMF